MNIGTRKQMSNSASSKFSTISHVTLSCSQYLYSIIRQRRSTIYDDHYPIQTNRTFSSGAVSVTIYNMTTQ